jgi:Ca2+-binding EF-hand superfamily protein
MKLILCAMCIQLYVPNIIISCLHDEDSSHYAHYVFAALDRGQSGTITFRDFMLGLSIVMKGTLQERLRWAFS